MTSRFNFKHFEGQTFLFGCCPFCRMKSVLDRNMDLLAKYQEPQIPEDILQALKDGMMLVVDTSLEQLHKEMYLASVPAQGAEC